MTEKKSIKASLSGLGASSLSLLGICCGSGACAATCGVACVAPVVSFFGISTASLATWANSLLPLLTAISAVAFTVAYYSIYKKKEGACCDDGNCSGSTNKNRWIKPIFWIGLLLTVGFYSNTILNNSTVDSMEELCCETKTSCSSVEDIKSCTTPNDLKEDK